MKYLGSKRKIANEILPLILERRGKATYVEPFVGGCGTFQFVDGPKIGGDIHPYLTKLLQALADGWIPPTITEMQYDYIHAYYDSKWAARNWFKGSTPWRKNPLRKVNAVSDELIGYAGFCLSYGAKWWGGYRRDKTGIRDYSAESRRDIIKTASLIKGAKFYNCSYDKIHIPPKSIIYCDPPYENTTSYSNQFNHTAFWTWCRAKHAQGHKIFVSEYNAPADFKKIWCKDVPLTVSNATGTSQIKTECLFTL